MYESIKDRLVALVALTNFVRLLTRVVAAAVGWLLQCAAVVVAASFVSYFGIVDDLMPRQRQTRPQIATPRNWLDTPRQKNAVHQRPIDLRRTGWKFYVASLVASSQQLGWSVKRNERMSRSER